jgi:hypothetical protein
VLAADHLAAGPAAAQVVVPGRLSAQTLWNIEKTWEKLFFVINTYPLGNAFILLGVAFFEESERQCQSYGRLSQASILA